MLYNIVAELETDIRSDEAADALVDALVGYHPAVTVNDRGLAEVTVSVDADTLRGAVDLTLDRLAANGFDDTVAVTAMTTVEYDVRYDIPQDVG